MFKSLLLSTMCLYGADAQAEASFGLRYKVTDSCSSVDYTCAGGAGGVSGFCQQDIVRWCAPGTTCDKTWTPSKGGNNPCAIITPPGPAPASKNIVQLAASVPDLSTLVTAVTAGKLVTTLESAGPFTVFAPTNEAFGKVPAATLAHLLEPANIKELDAVLTYHVLAGAVRSKDLKPFQDVKTVQGDSLRIVVNAGKVYVNNADVTAADNEASNGVVHIISEVLIPRA